MSRWDAKLEAQKQWTVDPCGAATARDLEPGTLAFYRKVEAERYESYAPWMKQILPFSAFSGRAVLEIGPGLGTDHAQFARAGARLFALDLTAVHLTHTRRRFALEGLVTRPVRGDAEALPFANGSFDAVYTFGVLHHTPDMKRAFEEIRRVLRPGGELIAALYHRHSAFYWIRTILLRGILRGGLVTRGYRRLLSEIEHRSRDSHALPLVQVLSRRECRRLLAAYADVRVVTAHIDYPHALPLARASSGTWRRLLERVAGRWGWYLIVFARK